MLRASCDRVVNSAGSAALSEQVSELQQRLSASRSVRFQTEETETSG